MTCRNCGKPLLSDGIVCKFCGALMNQSEINYQNQMNDKNNKKITLLSEKYGHENKIEYRETKENKVLGLAIIIIVLVFLVVLTILINR